MADKYDEMANELYDRWAFLVADDANPSREILLAISLALRKVAEEARRKALRDALRLSVLCDEAAEEYDDYRIDIEALIDGKTVEQIEADNKGEGQP